MTRYRLPDALGGGEIEATEVWGGCAGGRPEYHLADDITVLAPMGQPFEMVEQPPPEPPTGTIVLVRAGADRRYDCAFLRTEYSGWYGTTFMEHRTWEQLLEMDPAPALLVVDPFAEPVELPWKRHDVEVDQTVDGDKPSDHVYVSTRNCRYGFAHLTPADARDMARALWAVADSAERVLLQGGAA